ncbi:MAG: dUTP diphosphatase [Myxococcales bacterium]|jgi:dUTP pyrophosphatase
MKKIEVLVARIGEGRGQPLAVPRYMTSGAAGLDLCADVGFELGPGERKLIPTGLALEIPKGFEGQVRPRSGLAVREGVTVLNAPGTIDSDYRGEVQVCLVNLGQGTFKAERGARIAQLVIAPVVQADLFEVVSLSASERGAGGFGSTGS